MTPIDIHSAALVARHRAEELRREATSGRLVRQARAAVRAPEPASAAAPVMRVWLSFAAGNRLSGV